MDKLDQIKRINHRVAILETVCVEENNKRWRGAEGRSKAKRSGRTRQVWTRVSTLGDPGSRI